MKFKIILFALLLIFVFCVGGKVLAMTDQEKQALIAQIQQQIVALTQQLAQTLAQQQGGQVWCYNFNSNLGYQNSGTNDVLNLHLALQKEGISYSPDTIIQYGSGTSQAVSQFQLKYGIYPQTGYVGPKTRAQLNQIDGCSSNTNNNSNNNSNNNNDNNYNNNSSSASNNCNAQCVNQSGKSYAVDCYGGVDECQSGQSCQLSYDTTNKLVNGSIQTISTLTGARCTYDSSNNSTSCLATCTTANGKSYAIGCDGVSVTTCSSNEICQLTHDDSTQYINGQIQTTSTLTGSQCVYSYNNSSSSSSSYSNNMYCGDGTCNNGENCNTCYWDCGTCSNGSSSSSYNSISSSSSSACSPNMYTTTGSCINGLQTNVTFDANNCGSPATTQTVSCGSGSSSSSSGSSAGGCTTQYSCSCSGNVLTCNDLNGCGSVITSTCSGGGSSGSNSSSGNSNSSSGGGTCTPNWNCGNTWSACTSGTQTRSCYDTNNCGQNPTSDQTTRSCCSASCKTLSGSTWAVGCDGKSLTPCPAYTGPTPPMTICAGCKAPPQANICVNTYDFSSPYLKNGQATVDQTWTGTKCCMPNWTHGDWTACDAARSYGNSTGHHTRVWTDNNSCEAPIVSGGKVDNNNTYTEIASCSCTYSNLTFTWNCY